MKDKVGAGLCVDEQCSMFLLWCGCVCVCVCFVEKCSRLLRWSVRC